MEVPNKMNKLILIITILLLILPITRAEDFDIPLDITVHCVGDEYGFNIQVDGTTYEERGYDKIFRCNSSLQNDTTFEIEIEREIDLTEFNTSIDTEKIIRSLDNMSHQCDEVIAEYNFSQKYANTKATLGRIDAEHDECKKERDILISFKTNLTNDNEQCSAEKDALKSQINGPQGYIVALRNATQCCTEANTKSDENVIYLIAGAGLVGVVWYLVAQSKKKKRAPKEIRERGYE